MSYGGNRGSDGPQRERKDPSQMTPKERFDYAKGYRLNLPKGGGRSLNEIALDDNGLMYLDWLIGQQWINSTTRTALTNFLEWEPVAKDVERIKERRAIQEANKPGNHYQDQVQQEAPW